jgi:hypothetical protein
MPTRFIPIRFKIAQSDGARFTGIFREKSRKRR